MRIPRYRQHSTRDIGFIEWRGKRHYFEGRHDSPESREAYKAFVHKFVTSDTPRRTVEGTLSVAGLVTSFLDYAKQRYGGGSRGEYANCKHALMPLATSKHGPMAAEKFGPKKLKEWRAELVEGGASRQYANQQIGKLRRAFKWAASEELIAVERYHRLTTVTPLMGGETEAAESPKRRPVLWSEVEPVLKELSAEVADMVRIQWHTAVRSGSLCRATPEQFSQEGDLLLWRPRHKTESRGGELIVPIGPQCQAIVAKYIDGKPASEPLFNPRLQRPNRRYGKKYTPQTYYRAIQRAIERVNKQREESGDKPIEPWFPHQLRHSKAQQIRERYGVEAAQSHLGHESMDATEIYSSRRLELAKQIARDLG